MLKMDYPQVWFTYGPQTKDDDVIRELIKLGATGARLTFSFGTPELQVERAMQLRKLADELNKNVFIVADLQGEKCRLSKIDGVEEIPVRKEVPFLLTSGLIDLSNSPVCISVQIPKYLDELERGDLIIEGDGALIIKVVEKKSDGVLCLPEKDGILHPGRGILVQKRDFRPKSMTEKDKSDLLAISEADVFDAVAVSFVGSAEDIKQAQAILKEGKNNLPLISKIETQMGVDAIDEIAKASDGLMIARGDLALTAPWTDLYSNVLKIVWAAKANNVPWILATQIAEGLERFEFLTRAEICDLAHWISEGAAGVMLSYETAFGPKPVEAIKSARDVVNRYAKLN